VPLSSATGAGPDSAAAIFYGPSVPPFNLEADNALNNLFGPPVFALPSQQFFSVTPQMLATYFRPGERVSKNAMVVGPIPVGFMPPQPLPMPAISNRAAYIIK
jgi:hypothetical protein